MIPASLSPHHLLEILAPSLPLDAQLVQGYSLADCYRLDDDTPVCVELRRKDHSFEIEVEPLRRGGPKPMASAAGLGLAYRASAPGPLGAAACVRLAQIIEAELGQTERTWRTLPTSLTHLGQAVAAEIEAAPARLDEDPDHRLLARDFDAYERLYGVRPTAVKVRVLNQEAAGVSVHYPAPRNGRVPNSAAVYPAARRIAHRRRMRRYFAELGCAFDEQGCPRTIPTPATYARILATRGDQPQIRPKMIAGISASLRPVHWGILVRRHLLPVSVAPSWSVAIHQRIRDVELLRNIPCDVGMLVHDMGLHAMALHAVPAVVWEELSRQAFARVRAQPFSALAGPFGVLARLAGFFEGPVTTHCWDAWREADEPADFQRCFVPHSRALLDELAGL